MMMSFIHALVVAVRGKSNQIHSHIPIRARLSQRRVQGKGLEYRQTNSTFKERRREMRDTKVISRAKRQGEG